jgi:glycosyltransferase involved in cell wall biosynthesis
MAEPLVSVIIPTWNSALWIRETLASVRQQSYSPVEVVVVDDGSADETVALCRQDPGPPRIVSQPNHGRGFARNRGLEEARGTYLAFLDHDDLLCTDSIAERVRFLESHPDVGWVFTDAVEFDTTGDLRRFLGQFPWLNLGQDPFPQILRGCYPLTSTVMIRRSLVDRVGGFDTTLNYGDDLEYFMRLLLAARVGWIREPLTRRRIHPDQGVSSTFDRWHSRSVIYTSFLRRQPDLSAHHRATVVRALRHARFKLGECYWSENDFPRARGEFLGSLGPHRWTGPALLYSVLTGVPPAVVSLLRRLKRLRPGPARSPEDVAPVGARPTT